MQSSRRLVAIIIALAACKGRAPEPPQAPSERSPEWVVEQFYARPTFPDKATHLAGEMTEYASAPTMGEQIPRSAQVSSRVLFRDSSHAVLATAIRDSGQVHDFYSYLSRVEGVWKITELRTLALPPLVEMMRDELRAMRDRPDSLERMLRNVELTMESDSALKAYFLVHRAAFDALVDDFARNKDLKVVRSDGRGQPAGAPGRAAPLAALAALAAQLRALDASSVSRDEELSSCVHVVIGGIIDNAVGFLRADPGCEVPEITPSNYIYVERVAPNWFIYKTT